jgi:hypothetical protein
MCGPFVRVIRIDGNDVNKPALIYKSFAEGGEIVYQPEDFCQAKLLAGQHLFEVYMRRGYGAAAIGLIQATLHRGHIYELRTNAHMYPEISSDYAVMMTDTTTGKMVGGRTIDSIDWSWSDARKVLARMLDQRATYMDIIEKFGVPMAFYPRDMVPSTHPRSLLDEAFPQNSLVYAACTSKEQPFTELSLVWRSTLVDRRSDCGYLFLKFGASNEFQNYYFGSIRISQRYLADPMT